jgi:hypothetical protein
MLDPTRILSDRFFKNQTQKNSGSVSFASSTTPPPKNHTQSNRPRPKMESLIRTDSSYNSDHQNKLTEFNNAQWYPYKHKVYQEWELTFRSIMCFRGDNPYADYSMMGSFEDLARFFWSGMSYNDRKRFLEGVYFGKFYTEVEDMEDEWENEKASKITCS